MVVKDGVTVGEGTTEPRPGKHAEPIALAVAGKATKGATLYSSLEPHAFQGVAPPCTEIIIDAGISTVISPIEDPNPNVSGNGFRQLQAAGINVVRNATEEQIKRACKIIEGFTHHLNTRRPLISLKLAISLDGKIATRTGDSQWITNEYSRAKVHEMRRGADAVITGIGTIIADNPRLTSRTTDGNPTGRPLLRVVVDTDGRMPSDAAILHEPGDILWVVGKNTDVESNSASVNIHQAGLVNGKVDLAEVVDLLGEKGLHNVMVEAGGGLAGAFLENDLVDEVAVFISPKIIGGSTAPGPFAGLGISAIEDAVKIQNITHQVLDDDILIQGSITTK